MESQIQQGEQLVNKKSVNPLTEKSYIKYHHTPLLPAVKERMTNGMFKAYTYTHDSSCTNQYHYNKSWFSLR
jgi:hypothetical protein